MAAGTSASPKVWVWISLMSKRVWALGDADAHQADRAGTEHHHRLAGNDAAHDIEAVHPEFHNRAHVLVGRREPFVERRTTIDDRRQPRLGRMPGDGKFRQSLSCLASVS